jgi:hypothetical protein
MAGMGGQYTCNSWRPSSLRLTVFLQWIWTYMSPGKGVIALIVNHHGSENQAKSAAGRQPSSSKSQSAGKLSWKTSREALI